MRMHVQCTHTLILHVNDILSLSLSPQTGLTPLMEAASGGYYEVGKVLINKVM